MIQLTLDDHEVQGDGLIASLRAAWMALRDHRQAPGGSADPDLAAAEHYLFTRWCVASGYVSKGQMVDLSRLYYMSKCWHALWGDPNGEAPPAEAVSSPDLGVVIFGVMGALQGAADHAHLKVARTPPRWRPVKEIFGGDGFYRSIGNA